MLKLLKKYPFLSHCLFWVGVLLLYVVKGDVIKKFDVYLIIGLAELIPQIIAAYLTVYVLIPKFLQKKKYLQFLISFLVSAYLISVASRILMVYGAEPFIRTPPFEQESILEIFTDIKWLMLRYFPSIYIMVAFFWLITFLNISRINLGLEKEKTSTELKMLKSQLNPHFLFNTLNNIYALSLDNSPQTSASIGKLSEILDYILYRCNDKLVPLSGELALLDNYIALEKLRYDERLQVVFNKQIEKQISIAPLILLSLVENAFKHGAGEDGGSPRIYIDVASTEQQFSFRISNSLASYLSKSEDRPHIGLDNIKKQLNLIYGNNYELKIDQQVAMFTVELSLF